MTPRPPVLARWATAGGATGTLLAARSSAALASMLSDGLNTPDVRLPMDWGLLVALAAGWVPARRAAGMDPLDALQVE